MADEEYSEKQDTEEEEHKKELKGILSDMDQRKTPHLSSTGPRKAPVKLVTEESSASKTMSGSALIKMAQKVEQKVDAGYLSGMIESETPTGHFFSDLEIFFVQLFRAYSMKYEEWQETILSIFTIMRKFRDTIRKNTDNILGIIEGLNNRILTGLDDFKEKQSEVERFSDVKYNDVAVTFRKTLELLNFQLREMKLRRTVDELYKIYVD